MKNRFGKLLKMMGGICLLLAVVLTVYNVMDSERAEVESEETLVLLNDSMPDIEVEDEEKLYQTYKDIVMPTIEINGDYYVGILELPSIGLKFPVGAEWSDSLLKKAPCRYQGSVYENDMIIAGHNYRSHFSYLKKLNLDDLIYFRDMDGNLFEYRVIDVEIVSGDDIETMKQGEWDLTLFTCNYDGTKRFTVRCKAVLDGE